MQQEDGHCHLLEGGAGVHGRAAHCQAEPQQLPAPVRQAAAASFGGEAWHHLQENAKGGGSEGGCFIFVQLGGGADAPGLEASEMI